MPSTTITFDESGGFGLGFNGRFNPYLISADGQFRVEAFWLNNGGHFHIYDGGAGNLAEHNHNFSGGTPSQIQGIRITRTGGGSFALAQMDIFGQASIGMVTNFTTGAGSFDLYDGSGTFATPGTTSFGSTYTGVTEIYLADPGRAGGFSSSNSWDNIVLNVFSVDSSVPANGEVIASQPTDFVLNFSAAYDSTSVDATDLTVNGMAADSVVQTDGDTLTFQYAVSPVMSQGPQTMHMDEGAVTSLAGDPVSTFDATFYYDLLVLAVTSTSPADGSIVDLPFTTLDLNFNEDYDFASAQTSDFAVNQGSVSAVSQVDSDTLRLTLSGVVAEGTLTVDMPAGAMTDVYGNPGLAFSGSYTLDFSTTAFPTPLQAIAPAGSLIYDGSQVGIIGNATDSDTFSILVDPGQKITLTVDPAGSLRPIVELYRVGDSGNELIGSATAGSAGLEAVLQTAATHGQIGEMGPGPKTYLVVVRGAGGTTGGYSLRLILNAAVENESHDGATDNTHATAQSLQASFLTFNASVESSQSGAYPGRAAVLGRHDEFVATTVLSADFESGAQGFTIDNGPIPGHLPGQWHLSEGRGAQPGHSSSHSFYYGHDEGPDGGGTYWLGTRTPSAGYLISPSVALPATGKLQVDFNYVLGRRQFASDEDVVLLQVNAGSGWVTLKQYKDDRFDWASDTVDLTAYAGSTVQLRWQFDTFRGPNGQIPEGMYVDDVQIRQFLPVPDYYSFTLGAGESATLALTGGGLSMTLENAAGTTVATASTSAANVDRLISDYVAASAGTYYARIVGANLAGANYSLVVTRNAVFDTESNSEISSAQGIVSTKVAGQQSVLGFIGGAGSSGNLSQVNGPAYVRSVVGSPWGTNSNELAMDLAFGAGNWDDLRFETVDASALFSNQHDFVFLEGSDSSADELEFFLSVNQALIENYTAGGHNLFINSAPNEGDGMSLGFGDVNLVYPDYSPSVHAADPQHPIFLGPFQPVTTSYTGSYFGHASVTGSGLVPLILSDSGPMVLAEEHWGQGLVVFGGMTMSDFHSPQPEAFNLRANIIAYVASAASDQSDYYRVTVDALKMLEVQTSTPGGQAGEFVNDFDPMIRIYDSSGVLVASNDNSAPDGRNAKVSYKVPKGAGGAYYIEVLPSTASAEPTTGEYILTVKGNTAGHSQYLAGDPITGTASPLSDADLQQAVASAVSFWSSEGVDTSALRTVEISTADLVGSMLGHTFDGAIVIDVTAAGHGWALGGGGAAGTVDLYETVTHEMGHVLGFEHTDSFDVMQATLSPLSAPSLAVPGNLSSSSANLAQFALASGLFQLAGSKGTLDAILADAGVFSTFADLVPSSGQAPSASRLDHPGELAASAVVSDSLVDAPAASLFRSRPDSAVFLSWSDEDDLELVDTVFAE